MPAAALSRGDGLGRSCRPGANARPLKLAALAAAAVVTVASVLQRPLLEVRHPEFAMQAKDIDALKAALAQVEGLRAQVVSGKVVPKFGEKAKDILAHVHGHGAEVEEVVDRALHALFQRQVAIVGQEVAARFEQEAPGVGVLEQADNEFVVEASELIRPDATWSVDQERIALCARLMGAYRREAALLEERAQAARTQQVTIEVIGRLQYQMELLQQKAQGAGSNKSPWVLSSSYRIPNTPLQLVGKYEQGRADIELNLSPEKDPSTSEGGFAQSVGPANLGVSFNIGI